MIEISSSTAIVLYLSLSLIILFAIWLFSHYKARERKLNLVERELRVCEYCHFTYLETKRNDVSQCPQCQSFNKNNSYK